MSHTVEVDIELNNVTALEAACKRLGLKMKKGVHKLYSSTEEGIAIFLNDWTYPAVVREDGSVAMDTYEGQWGDIKEFNSLKQRYGLEVAAREARMKGYSVFETAHSNGDIELKIKVGG